MENVEVFEITGFNEIKPRAGDFMLYGIYILVWEDSPGASPLVYVGKAKRVQGRLIDHSRSYNLSGWQSAYAFVSTDFHDTYISELEAHLIKWMKGKGFLIKDQSYSFGNVPAALKEEIRQTYEAILSFVKSREQFQREARADRIMHFGDSKITINPERRTYLQLDHVLEELNSSDFRGNASTVEDVLRFCLSRDGVKLSKRKDKSFPRFAASTRGKNFCIVNVKKGFVTLDIALDRRERSRSCGQSAEANPDNFCNHKIDTSGLTTELQGHIDNAYRLRTGKLL